MNLVLRKNGWNLQNPDGLEEWQVRDRLIGIIKELHEALAYEAANELGIPSEVASKALKLVEVKDND